MVISEAVDFLRIGYIRRKPHHPPRVPKGVIEVEHRLSEMARSDCGEMSQETSAKEGIELDQGNLNE